MTDQPSMSAQPPHGPGRHPRGEPPQSIRTSVMLVWAIVAVSVVNAILTFVFLDDVVATAMQGQAVDVDPATVRMGAVLGGLVGLVIFGALWVVLAIFLRKGANWARIVLTILAALGVVFGLFGLVGAPQPMSFMATSVITLVLEAALLYYLWQKDSTSFLKPRPTY